MPPRDAHNIINSIIAGAMFRHGRFTYKAPYAASFLLLLSGAHLNDDAAFHCTRELNTLIVTIFHRAANGQLVIAFPRHA